MRTQSEASAHGRMYYFGPPLFGAVALFAIVALRMLANLSSMQRNPALRAKAPVVLAAVTGAGFLAGVVYVVLGRTARRVRFVGPYLAGVITVAGYMGALLLAMPYISADSVPKGRADWILFTGITVFFGVLAGHSWFRRRDVPRRGVRPAA